MNERFVKDSQAVLDYKWDWSDWLAVGESISTEEVAVTPSGDLTVDSHTHSSSSVTAWLSDGTDGSAYLVTCRITTSASRTDERSIVINCTFR